MSDEEPTHGELARRLDNLHADLRSMANGLVGRAEYVADQKAVDQRFGVVNDRIDDVRRQQNEDIRAVNERITRDREQQNASSMTWRNIIWMGLLPAAVALLMGLLTLYFSTRH